MMPILVEELNEDIEIELTDDEDSDEDKFIDIRTDAEKTSR
jgi:hypothetical protein